ncbi:MAG: methylmalonyl-CoA mutase family protein [Candidatus Nanopelagicales bacterium]
MTDPTPLADGFAPVDRAQWRELVAAALRRSRGEVAADDVERLLATPTDDGYAVHPLYTAADVAASPPPHDPGRFDFVRGTFPADESIDWDVRARHWLDEASAEAVRDDLANGVTSLWLTDGHPDRLTDVLAGVDLARVPVVVEGFRSGHRLAQALLQHDLNPGSSLGLDPLGLVAATRRSGDIDDAVDLAGEAQAAGIGAFVIDGSVYHDAGASFAEELGAVTATGLATLRLLEDRGMSIDDAARLIEFRLVVTDDQFASIAKLRAARILWARVLQVAGAGTDHGQRQHATTSLAMLTVRDPWVNLIRNTVAAFAGGVGGAEAVTVEPHTAATGEVDPFARRMARNTQLLLLQESHVGFVADPAGGSYYVETRTRQLAEAGWSWLRDIEAAGGMRAALDAGVVAKRIERTWERRAERTAKRQAPITGVSEFPDRERGAKAAAPDRSGDGLPRHRYAEVFEVLRDRADALAAPPTVALVTVGPLSRHGARQTFAENLFAAGGIATVPVPFVAGEPLRLPEGVGVVCVCGADDDYPDAIPAIGAAAQEAGVTRLLVAGRPGARAEADTAAGVTDHIYAGCDAVALLDQVLTQMEVPA